MLGSISNLITLAYSTHGAYEAMCALDRITTLVSLLELETMLSSPIWRQYYFES